MARNTATGPWATVREGEFVGDERFDRDTNTSTQRQGKVWIEQADMLDKKLGTVYPGAAIRVVVKGTTGCPRTKTFYGEMAWSNATRYANDAASWFDQRQWWAFQL
jgi:hypothetical protein